MELASLAPLSLLDSDYFHKNILSALALALSRNESGYSLDGIPFTLPKLEKGIVTTVEAFFSEIENKI